MQRTVDRFVPPPVPTRKPSQQLPDYLNELGQHLQLFETRLYEHLSSVVRQLNTGVQGFGADIAAAASITPSAYMHVVTGTAAISRIGTPPRYAGGPLVLIAADGFSLATGGNIASAAAVTAGTAVVLNYHSRNKLWYVAG